MPLTDRAFSVNTYILSKTWFKSATINIKLGDIEVMESKIKSWIYQDLFEKPQSEVLYHKTTQGGLGLADMKQKMTAHLLTTFLQTAINDEYKQNLYHRCLY